MDHPAPALDRDDIATLRTSLRGRLLETDDRGYDAARMVWNGMIDRHPALIACCAGVADVIESVAFARRHALPLSIRGGGHNVAGYANHGPRLGHARRADIGNWCGWADAFWRLRLAAREY